MVYKSSHPKMDDLGTLLDMETTKRNLVKDVVHIGSKFQKQTLYDSKTTRNTLFENSKIPKKTIRNYKTYLKKGTKRIINNQRR